MYLRLHREARQACQLLPLWWACRDRPAAVPAGHLHMQQQSYERVRDDHFSYETDVTDGSAQFAAHSCQHQGSGTARSTSGAEMHLSRRRQTLRQRSPPPLQQW